MRLKHFARIQNSHSEGSGTWEQCACRRGYLEETLLGGGRVGTGECFADSGNYQLDVTGIELFRVFLEVGVNQSDLFDKVFTLETQILKSSIRCMETGLSSDSRAISQ
jgi:hypothetical protein